MEIKIALLNSLIYKIYSNKYTFTKKSYEKYFNSIVSDLSSFPIWELKETILDEWIRQLEHVCKSGIVLKSEIGNENE